MPAVKDMARAADLQQQRGTAPAGVVVRADADRPRPALPQCRWLLDSVDGPQGSTRRVASAAKPILPALSTTAQPSPCPQRHSNSLLAALIEMEFMPTTRCGASTPARDRCVTEGASQQSLVQIHTKAYLLPAAKDMARAADLQQRGTAPAGVVVRAGADRPRPALPQCRCLLVSVDGPQGSTRRVASAAKPILPALSTTAQPSPCP